MGGPGQAACNPCNDVEKTMITIRHLMPLALALAAGTALATTPAPTKEAAKEAPAAAAATAQKAVKPVAATGKAPAAAERGRDWSQIDTNKDSLISPDEMEKWLAANPGPAKK